MSTTTAKQFAREEDADRARSWLAENEALRVAQHVFIKRAASLVSEDRADGK